MGHLGTDKDLEKLARQARRQGWTVETTGSNHLRWTSPSGRVIITGLTMSKTSVRHAITKLRRAGIQ